MTGAAFRWEAAPSFVCLLQTDTDGGNPGAECKAARFVKRKQWKLCENCCKMEKEKMS